MPLPGISPDRGDLADGIGPAAEAAEEDDEGTGRLGIGSGRLTTNRIRPIASPSSTTWRSARSADGRPCRST
jgi:hypothetical protein